MKMYSVSQPGVPLSSATPDIGDAVSRRDFLKGTGMLVVTVGVGELSVEAAVRQAAGPGATAVPPTEPFNPAVLGPDPRRLDTWLAIADDGGVTFFTGKNDNGQGIATAYRQLVADELDVPVDRVGIVLGDTRRTPDQRGASAAERS